MKNGNWFEDPSNNSIACRQTGPIEIGDINLSKDGDEVFKAGMSLIWKKLVVTRIYDKPNDTLIYLAHSRADGWLGEDVDLDDSALWAEPGLEEREAAVTYSVMLGPVRGI